MNTALLQQLRSERSNEGDEHRHREEPQLLELREWGSHPTVRAVYSHRTSEVKVTLEVPIEQQCGEKNLIGLSLWPSSVVLSRCLLDQESALSALVGTSQKNILELGSGCGLTAMMLALLGAGSTIVATDKPSVLPTLQNNLDVFRAAALDAGVTEIGHLQVSPLDWQELWEDKHADPPCLQENLPPLDVIVISDCLYSSASVAPLLAVLLRLLHMPHNANCRVLLANEQRSALDQFLSACRRGEGDHTPLLCFRAVKVDTRHLQIVPGLEVPVVVMIAECPLGKEGVYEGGEGERRSMSIGMSSR